MSLFFVQFFSVLSHARERRDDVARARREESEEERHWTTRGKCYSTEKLQVEHKFHSLRVKLTIFPREPNKFVHCPSLSHFSCILWWKIIFTSVFLLAAKVFHLNFTCLSEGRKGGVGAWQCGKLNEFSEIFFSSLSVRHKNLQLPLSSQSRRRDLSRNYEKKKKSWFIVFACRFIDGKCMRSPGNNKARKEKSIFKFGEKKRNLRNICEAQGEWVEPRGSSAARKKMNFTVFLILGWTRELHLHKEQRATRWQLIIGRTHSKTTREEISRNHYFPFTNSKNFSLFAAHREKTEENPFSWWPKIDLSSSCWSFRNELNIEKFISTPHFGSLCRSRLEEVHSFNHAWRREEGKGVEKEDAKQDSTRNGKGKFCTNRVNLLPETTKSSKQQQQEKSFRAFVSTSPNRFVCIGSGRVWDGIRHRTAQASSNLWELIHVLTTNYIFTYLHSIERECETFLETFSSLQTFSFLRRASERRDEGASWNQVELSVGWKFTRIDCGVCVLLGGWLVSAVSSWRESSSG